MNTPDNTILLAGFEPFGEFTDNPSEHIARALDGETIGDCQVKGIVLPVVYGDAGELLIKAIEKYKPRVVICLGLAANRKDISIERLAVNLDDADIPDNAGNQPADQAIVAEGPPACWSTLPVKAMVNALNENGIPASLSLSAGSFVCNHVFYHLMHTLLGKSKIKGGFVHLPPPEALATTKHESGLEAMLTGVRLTIQAACITP